MPIEHEREPILNIKLERIYSKKESITYPKLLLNLKENNKLSTNIKDTLIKIDYSIFNIKNQNNIKPSFNFNNLNPSLIPNYLPAVKDYIPTSEDFGYAYLTNAVERRALLERMVRMVAAMDEREVNAVVYCDRGARPLAVLVSELWANISERPLPPFFFINTNMKGVDPEDLPEESIDALRRWMISEYPDGKNPFRDGGVRACVVDELKVTGHSADWVAEILDRTFKLSGEEIYCDWANVTGFSQISRPWRDNEAMIGARTVPGEFRSKDYQTELSKMLYGDLLRLAKTHGQRPVLA